MVENGEKIEGAEGAANIDKTIKSLSGDNTIAVVAVSAGKSLATVPVYCQQLDYSSRRDLQFRMVRCSVVWRFQGCHLAEKMMPIRNSSASRTYWGTGKHMTFNLTDKKGTDQNGPYHHPACSS